MAEIHAARKRREAATRPARPRPVVPQPMVDPSPELEDLMRTMVLEGRVESSMQSPTLEEAIGRSGGDFEPDVPLPDSVSPPGTGPGGDGSELGAAALSLSSWSEEMDSMDNETSSQAGDTMVAKVPAAAAKGGDGPTSFDALEEVHPQQGGTGAEALGAGGWAVAGAEGHLHEVPGHAQGQPQPRAREVGC